MNKQIIATVGCLAIMAVGGLTVNAGSTKMLSTKLDESNVRVAALEQQNDEIKEELASVTDALEIVYEEYESNIVASATLKTNEVEGDVEELYNSSIIEEQEFNVLFEEEEEEEIIEEEQKPVYTYYGTKELTAYVATGNPCADGVYPQVGYTAASNDPNLWHKWIYIEGYGDYYVHDTGGMSTTVIDLFFGSYSEAIQFGRQSANIYVYE